VNNEAVLAHPLHQELLQKYEAVSSKLEVLQLQFNQLLKMVNGSKQERFIPVENPLQPTLFNLTPTQAEPVTDKVVIERRKPTKKKDVVIAEGKRLPEHLRREVIVIEPKEDITGCKQIGVEESEQLHFKPGELYSIVTSRPKYARPDGEGIIIAPMPDRIKERSIIGNSLAAKIAVDKFVYHTPLYRQSKQLAEINGVDIPVNTMSDTMGYVCDSLLPLYEKIGELIFKENYLQADETPHKVLDPNTKGKAHLGYMWVYRAPQSGLVYFDYRKGRGREGPDECLKNFKGYLQTDGYQVYDAFEYKEGITLTGCMAHARRKFYDAQKNDRNRAVHILTEIGALYKTEDKLRDENATPEKRYEVRQKESRPLLDALKIWLDEEALKVLPKSSIGMAMSYMITRWDKITGYLNDGILEIDNNLIENAIRPVALGRKNYLFAGSDEGAKRAAMMYTFFAMCKINDINPTQWLEETIDKLPSWPINRIEELFPLKK
jgi:transposase